MHVFYIKSILLELVLLKSSPILYKYYAPAANCLLHHEIETIKAIIKR